MNRAEELAKKIFKLDDTMESRSGGAHKISLYSVIDRSQFEDQWPVSKTKLAGLIDHTILKPDAVKDEIIHLCQEAEKYKFRSVCVNPCQVSLAREYLTSVDICCVVGFPLGANRTDIKLQETLQALADGAVEIDMVINVGMLKSENYEFVLNEITELARACHENAAILKVIIETGLLSLDEKIIACLLAKKAGADFVKTSTGFSSGGATVEDVRLMREVVGLKMGVKASGGIRNTETALQMIEAGANRIGASNSIKIIEGKE